MEGIFVERVFDLANGDEVTVRFLVPENDGSDYLCSYKIIWPDRERTFFGAGVDSVQALLNAMCNAHADLLSSPESKSGAIRWLGMEDLALPLADSLKPGDFE